MTLIFAKLAVFAHSNIARSAEFPLLHDISIATSVEMPNIFNVILYLNITAK